MRDGLNMLGSLIKLLLVRRNQALCSGKYTHSSKRADRKWHRRSSNNRMDVFKRNRRRKCNRGNRQARTSGQSGRKSAMCANVRSHDQNPFDYSQSNISGFRHHSVSKSHACAPAENDEVSCSWETLGPKQRIMVRFICVFRRVLWSLCAKPKVIARIVRINERRHPGKAAKKNRKGQSSPVPRNSYENALERSFMIGSLFRRSNQELFVGIRSLETLDERSRTALGVVHIGENSSNAPNKRSHALVDK